VPTDECADTSPLGRGSSQVSSRQNIRLDKKVLDKPRAMCYNKGTKRGCNDRTSAEQECNLPNAPRSDDGE
jgi:hypothetical protein